MASPRQPTPSDRHATRALSRAIVSSVAADEEMPLGLDEPCFASGRYGFYSEDVESLVYSIAAEVVALQQERDRLRAAVWAVIDMFDGASYNFRNRGKGGQHVPYHGDFASMPPSAASQFVLAVLPVVRAAEAWRDAAPPTNRDRWLPTDLIEAIDQMRAALEAK